MALDEERKTQNNIGEYRILNLAWLPTKANPLCADIADIIFIKKGASWAPLH